MNTSGNLEQPHTGDAASVSRARVVGAFLLLFAMYAVWQSPSVLLPSISTQENWSLTRTTAVFSLAFFVYGFASPLVGWAIDRFGARIVFRMGSAFSVIGLGTSTLTRSVEQLTITYGVIVAIGISAVGVMPVSAYIRATSSSGPGRAVGKAQVGLGVGPMVMLPLVGWGVGSLGWRTTVALLTVVVVAATVIGLWHIEGADHRQSGPVAAEQSARTSTRALYTSGSTWLFVVGVMFMSSGFVMINVHQVAYLAESGFAISTGGVVAGVVAGVSAFGRLIWGRLTDQLSRLATLLGIVLATFLGVICLYVGAQTESWALLLGYGVLFGIGYSGIAPLLPAVADDMHGIGMIGRTLGIAGIGIGIGASVGPIALSALSEQFGSYGYAIFLPVLVVALGGTMLFATN